LRERNLTPRQLELDWRKPGLPAEPMFAALPEVSTFRNIASNLAACLAPLPKTTVDRAYAPMFRSAYFRRRFPGRALAASLLWHVGVIACLVNLPSFSVPPANPARAEAPKGDQKIIWYYKADLLPTVTPLQAVARPQPRKFTAARGGQHRTSAAVQTIVSSPPKPDNQRQTIIEPEAPNLRIASHIEVPNLVQWTGVAVPPRPVASEATRQLARIAVPRLPAPAVAPPPVPLPPPPDLRLPARLEVPEMVQAHSVLVPPRPVPSEATRTLARIALPKLPAPAVAPPPPKVPEPPALNAGINVAGAAAAVRNLIAVDIAPASAPEPISIPEGNRSGEFAIQPGNVRTDAETGGARNPGKGRQGDELPELAGRDLGGIRVPGLSITGGGASPADIPGPVVASPPRPPPARPSPMSAGELLARQIAAASRPSLFPEPSPGRQPEPWLDRSKRVYTVAINMPNMTSGSGSWVMRFAELNDGAAANGANDDLSTPIAVRKVDPRYVPSAVRERVEGTVTLGAHIRRDGTVSNIRVLASLDPRLDSSAAAALSDWQFIPARKNGIPVDLEIVVQIPFRLPSF